MKCLVIEKWLKHCANCELYRCGSCPDNGIPMLKSRVCYRYSEEKNVSNIIENYKDYE